VVVAMSPDGRVAACGDSAGVVRAWEEPFTGSPRTLCVDGPAVGSLAFSADGKRLAAVGADCTARVWEVETGKEILALPAPEGIEGASSRNLPSVKFSPDGRVLAASLMDVGIWAWEVESGKVGWVYRP